MESFKSSVRFNIYEYAHITRIYLQEKHNIIKKKEKMVVLLLTPVVFCIKIYTIIGRAFNNVNAAPTSKKVITAFAEI